MTPAAVVSCVPSPRVPAPLRSLALLALIALLGCGGGGESRSTGPDTTPSTTPPPAVTWTQVWSDEFDGPAGTPVDDGKWTFDIGDGCPTICGWGNNEKEFYTNSIDNASLDGQGNLAIVARPAVLDVSCYYGPCRYTSARITTRGKLAAGPGRVEARIKLPVGQGLWPAFWMLGNDFGTVGWPTSGELDIMENRGSAPRVSGSAVHGPGYSGATPFHHENSIGSGTLADAFHVYTVEWNASLVHFYVDGTAHYSVGRSDLLQYGPSILDKPYFIILNLAVGGNFDGDPATDAILPATMLVDYVRVYTPSSP
jgi:beta-glucanase (GH16 family)